MLAKNWTLPILKQQLKQWDSKADGKYKPYCGIVIWKLKKEIMRLKI